MTVAWAPAAPSGSDAAPERARAPVVAQAVVVAVAAAGAIALGPLPAVAFLLAAGLGLASLAWPETATLAFVVALWGNLLAVATRFHGLPAFASGAFVLVLTIPLLHHLVVRRGPLVVTPALGFVLLYLAAMLLAAATSATVTEAVGPVGEFVVEGLLIFVLLTNVVRSPATLRRVLWAVVLVSAAMSALSVLQEVTGAYDNDFAGLAQVTEQGFKVDETTAGKELRPRLAGPIGEQNRYAQVLLVALPFAVFAVWTEQRARLRLLAAGCSIVIVAGMLLTFSRGAALGLGVLFVLAIGMGFVRLRQAIVIAAVATALTLVVAPDFVIRLASLARVTSIQADNSQDQADGAVQGRATSNLAAWNTFVDHPLTGVGPGRYFVDYSQQAANELDLRYFDHNRRAHNLYLETAADLGLLGIGTLLAAVGTTTWHLARLRRRWARDRPDLAALAAAMLFAVVGYLTTAVFLHLSYQRYFWTLLALASSTVWILQREALPGAAAAPAQPAAVPSSSS